MFINEVLRVSRLANGCIPCIVEHPETGDEGLDRDIRWCCRWVIQAALDGETEVVCPVRKVHVYPVACFFQEQGFNVFVDDNGVTIAWKLDMDFGFEI